VHPAEEVPEAIDELVTDGAKPVRFDPGGVSRAAQALRARRLQSRSPVRIMEVKHISYKTKVFDNVYFKQL
jgi:hypothetical protein